MIFGLLASSCSKENKDDVYKNEFEVLIADSFYVTLTDLTNGQKNTVFTISKESNYIITSASFDKKNKIIAVSLIENNGSPEKSQIIFINNTFPYKEIGKIHTKFSRIRGLSYSNIGDLAFIAGGAKLDGPNSICVIRNLSKNFEVVSYGRYISNISWDYEAKKVYFSSIVDGNRTIGYVHIDTPNVINEITEGISVCTSLGNSKIFVLAADARVYTIENGIVGKKLKFSNRLDPRFVDSISCVRFGEGLIVQEYIKATTYKLLVVPPPFESTFTLLPAQPMQSFEVVKK